jgi:hypothetical protein
MRINPLQPQGEDVPWNWTGVKPACERIATDFPADAPAFLHDALLYWQSKLAGRRMPSRRDFDPVFEIPRLLPWVMLTDVLREPLDFRYRLIGTGIVSRSRRDHTGSLLSQLTHAGPASVVWRDRLAVVETRSPKFSTPPYAGGNPMVRGVSGIHLPLSADGETVNMIFTFVTYETVS